MEWFSHLSPKVYLRRRSIQRTWEWRDGLFSWKRSPPRRMKSTACSTASCSTSSKATKLSLPEENILRYIMSKWCVYGTTGMSERKGNKWSPLKQWTGWPKLFLVYCTLSWSDSVIKHSLITSCLWAALILEMPGTEKGCLVVPIAFDGFVSLCG